MNIKSVLDLLKAPSSYEREGKQCYFDDYRKKLIEITPEEIVRQKTASYLVEKLGVPTEMIKLEMPIAKYGVDFSGRADIVIHELDENGLLLPIAVVECKKEDIPLTSKVHEQAISYCDALGAMYYAITNGVEFAMFVYSENESCYLPLERPISYQKMVSDEYTVAKYKPNSFKCFSKDELHNLELINKYNFDDNWIFGEDTPNALRPFAINYYQCLMDETHKLPVVKNGVFEMLSDLGLRYEDYSNAGGGHYESMFRSFFVRDRFGEPQIVSLMIFGTMGGIEFDGINRTSYTSMVVSIDKFKISHNILQYNLDKYSQQVGGKLYFTHNGQLSGIKSDIVKEKVRKLGSGLSVEDGDIVLGSIATDKLLYIDDREVTNLIYNLIEYGLLREEVRKDKLDSLT